MKFAVESLAQVRDEIEPLLALHYREVALHQDVVPLAPDWGRYEGMEQNRALAVYTARDEGRLVGYSVFFLSWHIHYLHTLVAANDVLFLHPKYRKGLAGYRLIRFSEAQLRELGVQRVLWHIKVDHDFRAMLHRLGYADEEVIVGKVL